MEITKTQKYLFPALYFGYDIAFKRFLFDLAGSSKTPAIRLNSYLGDVGYKEITDKCIFILLRVVGDFNAVLETFRAHESYKDDYEVGGFDSDYHMVICRIDDEQAYNYFMLSRYSKMYSDEVLESNFCMGEDPKTKEKKYLNSYHVFKKTKERKEEIRGEFTVNKKGHEFDDFEALEYEGKLSMFNEIFDIRKLKE